MRNFEKIYETNIDTVYKICLIYLKKPHDAEEASQETFMKYLRYLPHFENDEHEKRWFIKTSNNICKNILKSSWFKKIICYDNVPELSTEENNEGVLQEILDLPNKYKTTIYLFYYEGYSTEEIAKILDMKPSTIRSNLHRARKMLKVSLEDDNDER
ncbi:MAG: RNA polymerase sigma factor [Paraclostridium sp.]